MEWAGPHQIGFQLCHVQCPHLDRFTQVQCYGLKRECRSILYGVYLVEFQTMRSVKDNKRPAEISKGRWFAVALGEFMDVMILRNCHVVGSSAYSSTQYCAVDHQNQALLHVRRSIFLGRFLASCLFGHVSRLDRIREGTSWPVKLIIELFYLSGFTDRQS